MDSDRILAVAVFENAALNEAVMRKADADEPLSLSDLDSIVRGAEKHADLLERLKQARLAGNTLEVLKVADEICGLEKTEETKQ